MDINTKIALLSSNLAELGYSINYIVNGDKKLIQLLDQHGYPVAVYRTYQALISYIYDMLDRQRSLMQ